MLVLTASETRSALRYQIGLKENELFEIFLHWYWNQYPDMGKFVKSEKWQVWIDRRLIIQPIKSEY
jgi:hypothetical protein